MITKRVKISLQLPKTITLEQANAKLTLGYQAYFKVKPEFPKMETRVPSRIDQSSRSRHRKNGETNKGEIEKTKTPRCNGK